jgi:serine/threonine protein kinase
MRIGQKIKLIDLDASVSFLAHSEGISGLKYSSAYVPPELIHADERIVCVKSPLVKFEQEMARKLALDLDDAILLENADLNFDYVPAAPAHDIWSIGVVLYNLAAKAPLLRCDYDGNVALEADLRALADWSDEVKHENLARIPNRYARNLVSLLLTKDPTKRPSMERVLAHPFITGAKATRLQGDPAEFDVFISYRVASDGEYAKVLYEKLTAAGVKVWFDQTCLVPGESWEQGFCRGLVKSRIFLPILSKGAINHDVLPRQNFAALQVRW